MLSRLFKLGQVAKRINCGKTFGFARHIRTASSSKKSSEKQKTTWLIQEAPFGRPKKLPDNEQDSFPVTQLEDFYGKQHLIEIQKYIVKSQLSRCTKFIKTTIRSPREEVFVIVHSAHTFISNINFGVFPPEIMLSDGSVSDRFFDIHMVPIYLTFHDSKDAEF